VRGRHLHGDFAGEGMVFDNNTLQLNLTNFIASDMLQNGIYVLCYVMFII